MFRWLGDHVVRHSKVSLCLWLVLGVLSSGILSGALNRLHILPVAVPQWNDVVEDGEFAFLPHNMPSIQAEDLFRKAFPNDRLASSVVLVLRRNNATLTDQDHAFITDELTPRLEELHTASGSIIEKVRDFNDNQIGKLLESGDGKATLVVVELKHEFLDQRNQPTIDRIEQLVAPDKGELRAKIPKGLDVAISGAATVGRDMLVAAEASASSTHFWTVLLVVGLLLTIYRAPFVALIPLVSVFVSVQVSMAALVLLTWLGQSGVELFALLKPFSGLRTYISVVVYGAGVDYCLFLVARYKEELDRGVSVDQALTTTFEKVGSGLVASAATVACGIGMMVFALFGKFQQAGITMAFSLLVMLVCSLTLTPALIRLAGKYAFWPYWATPTKDAATADPCSKKLWSGWFPKGGVQAIWECIACALMKRPGIIWITSVLMMLPCAVVGVLYHDDLSYGLLSELPPTTTSVVGAKAIQQHFAAGETGPLTVLVYNPKLDFSDGDTFDSIETLVQKLKDYNQELGLKDIRSAVNPLGMHVATSIFTRGAARRRYISTTDGFAKHVVRLDLILNEDPFSRGSMRQVEFVQTRVHQLLPAEIREGTQLHFMGITPSLLDLKTVTDRDQLVIDGAVMAVVLVILIILLQMVSIPIYLVLSVFYSYFVSLGLTITIFRFIDPQFDGIDWKVPIFLFTILVAVGEDYNIFLMARVQEDQKKYGPIKGIRTAMLSTGGIISSCGLIMAGTFFSLVLAGHLRGAQQLGTALTIGVLLDTFIIRPVLVPAWLVMLNTNRFGPVLSRLLGGTNLEQSPPTRTPPASFPTPEVRGTRPIGMR